MPRAFLASTALMLFFVALVPGQTPGEPLRAQGSQRDANSAGAKEEASDEANVRESGEAAAAPEPQATLGDLIPADETPPETLPTQTPRPLPPAPETDVLPPVEDLQPCRPHACGLNMRHWVGVEYLLWRISNAPVRVPLVSGNADPASIGALGTPGTVVLFGAGSGRSNDYDVFSGGRVTVGSWLDREGRFGLEASGFLLGEQSVNFNAASAGGTAPIVSIPFNATQPFNNNPQGPANLFTNPAGPTAFNSGNAPNAVSATITSRLWGAEANGVASLYSSGRTRIVGLIGFRYIDLFEKLNLTDATLDTLTGGILAVSDDFGTRNQFYGGQIGARAMVTFHRWNVDTGLKVAFGSNHEVLNVGGATAVSNGAFGFNTGSTPGGIFAQTTNIGTYDRSVFTVVPEVQFKLSYLITPKLRTFVGYNYLFMSNVLRPGNQIDANTQALFFVPPGTGGAPTAPTLRSSTFTAHGVNFGVAVTF